MQNVSPNPDVDIEALKVQVDADIAARIEAEADYARYIHRQGFKVGSMRLLVDMDAASEVAKMPPLFRLPGSPTGVRGLVNRQGRVVPVLDLFSLFENEGEAKGSEWLLVYGRGDDAVGLMVDCLPDRKRFAQDSAVALEEVTHPIVRHAQAAYREDEEIWIDIDMELLLSSIFKLDSGG
ncbi:MAG: chemotaxis protein CheW [Gallionella sp.]